MGDRYIYYNIGDRQFKVSESEREEFEKLAPEAKMNLTYNGKNHYVSLSELGDFVNTIGGTDGITYSSFDDNKNYSASSSTSPFSYSYEPEQESTPAPAEEEESGWKRFWRKAGEAVTRAQVDSLGMPYEEEKKPIEHVTVDSDFADSAINSHEEHKKQIDKEINKIDEEYYAKKANEPKKSFWRKLLELPLTAQQNEMIGDDAFSLEMKSENREKGKNYTDALIAKNISEKVGKKVDQFQDPAKTFVGGVFQGLGDAVFDMDTWDQSIGLEQASRVMQITQKLEKGQALTKGEQMIIDALVDDLATDALAATFGRGYKAGKVTGESLPFMLETALNPASGLGKAITQKFGKKILGSVFGKAGLYATRLLSDVAGAGIMSATTSAPRVAADAMNRLSGNVDFTIDDEGALQFNGFVDGEDSEWKAFGKAFGSDMIGHFSEMVGNYFGPLGHRAGRWTKKQVAKAADAFGWKNIAKNIRTATPNGFGTMLNDFLEQTQWNGNIGEFSEEMIGGVLDALIVGDQSLNPEDENYLFDKDNLIDTFLGVSIMGGAISGVKTLGYTTPEAKYNKAISEAQKGLEGHVSAEEMKMLEAFANNPFGADYANLRPFFADGKSEEDKKAVGKYISAIMQKQGYDISRNAQISGTKQGLEEMKSAYKLGQNMTEADIYDVNEAVNQAAAIVENDVIANYHFDVGLGSLDGETFISGEDLRNASSYDLFRIAESDKYGLSEETRNAFRTLALAKNTQEGLAEKLTSEANNAIKLHNQISIKASDKNGRLVKGMLGGNIVYVKGDVKTENGAIVKPEGVSSYPVEIIDSMTGETKTVNSNEINGIEDLNVNEYNMDMANTIYEGFNNRWTEWSEKMSVKAKLNQVQQMVGSHIYINNGKSDLVEVEVQQILPNGEVLLKGKKGDLGGQSTIRVDVDSLYDSITRDEEGNVIFAKQSEFRSQTENIKNANPDRSNYEKKAGTAPQQTAQPVAPETTTTEEVQPEPVVETAPVVDETEPEIEDFNEMEVDILINGVPVKVEVTNQDDVSGRITYRYTNENGEVKVGGSTIEAFRKAYQDAKAYQQPQSTEQVETEVTPTVDTVEEVTTETPVTEPVEATENVTLEPEDINWDALFESDKDAFLAELQNQWGDEAVDFLNEEIEVAQKEIEELSNAKTSGMSERSANRKKKKALQERIDILNGMVASISAEDENKTTVASQHIMPEPVVVPMQKDPEPMNAVQFAARELGLRNGGIKLQVDSFKHHTGYGNEEVKKFFGLFRSANKGGLTLEEAGERLMEIDRENYTGFFDQNDPNAGIDAILDALSLNRTMGELRTFAAREQQAQAQNEADAAYSAMMAEYEARLGESVAETVEMEEDSDAVIWQDSLTDEDYEEFLAIFTDEKNEHGTNTDERETSAVSGDEKAGNIQSSDRGAEENSEASNTILQAEQPIYTRGEEVSTGESSALGSEVGEQNVVPSVSPRKQQEIEGTLDEDMPDFTTEVKKTPVAPNPVPNPIAAAKDREAKLLELLNRNAVSDELKADAAKRAGKEVADMFATREAYEAYEADAADLGAFVEIFDEGVEESFATRNNQNNASDSDALLFRKKMIKDFSDMTDEELYDFLDEYERQHTSYSTDGNAYHNYLKEPNKDIIEAIKKSIISNEIDEVGSSVVFVGDYAYLVDHLKPSELSQDSNGIGIVRKVNISGVEKSEKDVLREKIHAGSVRNRRDVNQWIGAYRAKRELYNRYFGSAEDAEAAMVDGRLDWKELRERLLSRNEGSVEKGGLSAKAREEVLRNSTNSQNSAVDYLAGKPRTRAIERAVNKEAQKLGVQVIYKTREQMPKGHKNDKGYFNTETGEVVVCTENATSIADAIQTILHEAVAHKGLRQLMGEKFNEFINRVYESLDAETKAKVDAIAEASYKGDTAVATEEYLASLAETMDFENKSIWEKVKSIFNDIINAILGRDDIKIGDNDLRYILRASYNNMVNPRGMETVRGWAQDQMMREEYKINQAETPEILSRTGVDPIDVAKETAKTVYDRVVNSSWNEFQRQFQDAYQPVRVAIDAIQAETGNIPIEDYENYLLIQNQSSSRSRVEIDTFQRRYYSPIIEQVNKIIDTILDARGFKKGDKAKRAEAYKEVLNYLIAKHGLERNEYYQTHKTRSLTAAEMKPELDASKKEYNEKILAINENTAFTEAERELAKRDALDEYNAAVTEIKTRQVPDMRDYSGLTSLYGMEPSEFEAAEAEARMAVEEFEKMFEGEGVIESLWKKINAATNKTLKHSYESGMISRQQYEDIKKMFKFYIPLRGFSEETAEDVYSYARFEGNRFNPAVSKAQGRTSVADDPIAIIMNMAESEIAQGNKNRAKQALYNYLLNRASGKMGQNSLMNVEDVWYYVSTDENGETVYTIAAPDHANGETYEAFENKMQALAEDGKAEKSKKGKVDIGKRFQKKQNEDSHYVYLKVNGVDKAIYINGDPKAVEAINARNNKQPNSLTDKMRDANRVISSTFTNYSLGFTARNYFRDLIYARIAVDVKEKGAEYKLKFRKNWYVGNVAVMMKMLSDYRNGKYDNGNLSELQAAFVDFMNNGGQTGYTLINSVENRKAELEKAIARMQNGVDKGGIKDSAIFKYTFGAVEFLNEAMELRTRFAAFKTSRDLGRGINTAINDAKEITVNFNTKGAQDGTGVWGGLASYFGWSKYFFNASVQGVQNLTAMAKKSPIKFGTVVCSITALGFMMPIIQAALYEAIGGDDDDYWNIPEYDRQNNLCIMIGGGKYVKMPLPIGFREMYAIGDMVAAMVFDKKFERDVEQIGLDMANKVASVVLPINPLESSANGLNIWASIGNFLAPSSAQFLIQNAMNVDWKGAPLQKEYTYNEDDPQWMKAFNNNPMWMKSLSKWCNENINLDGDYKGMDWSPEKLDNTLSNLGGGIYTVIKQFGQLISTAMDDEKEFNISNVPFAGVAVGSGIDSNERFVTDAYFDMKDYYDSNVNSIKRTAKTFGYDDDDVFVNMKGQQKPKMSEIYTNENFEFMKEWYKGNKKLEDKKNEIKKLEKEIASKENPSEGRLRKLDRLNGEFETMRSEFVNKMLELE